MAQVVTVNGADFAGAAEHTDSTITATLRGTADYAAIDAVEMIDPPPCACMIGAACLMPNIAARTCRCMTASKSSAVTP